MPPFVEYLLKLSLALLVFYGFYLLILRRLTFYSWNRWYLLGYSVLALLIPFINITPMLEDNELTSNSVVRMIPSVQGYTGNTNDISPLAANLSNNTWTQWDWLLFVAAIGSFVLLAKLLINFVSLRRIRRNAELISDGDTRIFQVDQNIIPFSFGKDIFINPHLHSDDEIQEIIRHEFVHVRQKHSIDIIWGELLCIFNWFNPAAWLIRHAIRQNLEFIADDKVTQSGIDRKQYQYLLLKVIGNNHFSIANKFNFSSLKKRIAMMNKIRSARIHLFKFSFLLPLLGILLLAFRTVADAQQNPPGKQISASNILQKKIDLVDNDHNRQVPFVSVYRFVNGNNGDKEYFHAMMDTIPPGKNRIIALHRNDAMDIENRQFFERNKDVNLLTWKNNGTELQVYHSDQSAESYQLSDPKAVKKFEEKYGKMPVAKPGSVGWVDQNKNNGTSFFENSQGSSEPSLINNSKGFYTSVISQKGADKVVVWGKDKREIAFVSLSDWLDKKEYYEGKYGELTDQDGTLEFRKQKNRFLRKNTMVDNLGFVFDNFRDNQVVIVHVLLKNGKSEEYDFRKPGEKERAEKKYGSLPLPRPAIGDSFFSAEPTTSVDDARFKSLGFQKPMANISIVADTILLASEKGLLQLKGNATLFDRKQNVRMTSDVIDLHQEIGLIYIDGKQIELNKDFVGEKGGRYDMKTLDAEAAVRKYGQKGFKGAVEITSW